MKIKVPEYVLKHDLTDHELVFCSFMGWAGRRGAKNVRWYMHSDDIKHMLGHVVAGKSPNRKTSIEYHQPDAPNTNVLLEGIRKVFTIGMPSYHTFTVDFNAPDDAWNRNGSIRYAETEINSLEAIKIYYYIIGRISGSDDLIQDGAKFHPVQSTRKSTVVEKFFQEHFMI